MQRYTKETIDDVLNQASIDFNVPTQNIKLKFISENKDANGILLDVTYDAYTMDDVKEFIFDYLGNFFTSIDEEIEVSIEERENSLTVNLNAENNAVLIGKMGRTIDAFNKVVRNAINTQFPDKLDILIDVNHYKEDRYNRIRSMAKRLARQVQKSKVDIELDPMPSDERKIIHKTLNEWRNIKTDSEGIGAARHICIRYMDTHYTH